MKTLLLLLLTITGNLFASIDDEPKNDTLYNTHPFLIYFNESDTSMHFEDRSNNFHFHEKKSCFYYYDVHYNGPQPFSPELIYVSSSIFYFTFGRVISLHGIDYHAKHMFEYNRENRTFEYIPLSDNNPVYIDDDNKFDYFLSVTGRPYKEDLKIIRRKNKTYLRLILHIYPLGKGKPQKIKKIYTINEFSYLKGYYFKLIFIKNKSHFQVRPYIW